MRYSVIAVFFLEMACSASSRNVTIIYTEDDRGDYKLPCPSILCEEANLADIACGSSQSNTVIVSGHSEHPLYLGIDAAQLAEKIQCYRPRVIILDTCNGFSMPILSALVGHGYSGLVLGSIHKVPPAGLGYGPGFFEALEPGEISALVGSSVREGIQRWNVDIEELVMSHEDYLNWSSTDLVSNLEHIAPNLVRVPLVASGQTMIVPTDPDRFR